MLSSSSIASTPCLCDSGDACGEEFDGEPADGGFVENCFKDECDSRHRDPWRGCVGTRRNAEEKLALASLCIALYAFSRRVSGRNFEVKLFGSIWFVTIWVDYNSVI